MSVSADGDDLVLRPAADGVLEILCTVTRGTASPRSGVGTRLATRGTDRASTLRARRACCSARTRAWRVGFPAPRCVRAPGGGRRVLRAAVSAGESPAPARFLRGANPGPATRAPRRRRASRGPQRGLPGPGASLAEVPDSALVQRAAAGQSEIVAEGIELKALAAEVERASFFGLEDLYARSSPGPRSSARLPRERRRGGERRARRRDLGGARGPRRQRRGGRGRAPRGHRGGPAGGWLGGPRRPRGHLPSAGSGRLAALSAIRSTGHTRAEKDSGEDQQIHGKDGSRNRRGQLQRARDQGRLEGRHVPRERVRREPERLG